MTQPPFSLTGPEREVFHICRLPHIFHFSISVDIRTAFIQFSGLVLMLCVLGLETNPCSRPPTRLIPVTSRFISVENTCCWLAWPSVTRAGQGFLSSPPGLGPEWAPPPPRRSAVMGIQGMELFAIGVVIILFMAVLKQFGILEPMSSFEGKGPSQAPLQVPAAWLYCYSWWLTTAVATLTPLEALYKLWKWFITHYNLAVGR